MIVLASNSPRRKEICALLDLPVTVIPARHEEAPDPSLSPENAVMRVARAKAAEVFASCPDALVIGADTAVLLENTFLGKPRDEADAARMLRALSGRQHRVLTGVALLSREKEDVFCESASVWFRRLAEEEIRAYIASGEPMDKAGAYGIQGRGAKFVSRIDGDFYTVMGLPCAALYERLQSFRK